MPITVHNCHTQHSTQQLWLFSLCTSTPSTQLRCYLLESSLASCTERITFKVVTLTYHALHGSAPPYLASSFTCVADMPHQRRLRSASTEQLDVPTCRRSTIRGRAFPVAGAKVWNGLPVIGVSRPPVLDYGTTFHVDSGGRDLPSTLLDNLWKLIYLATEALSDSFEFIGAI